VRPSTGRTGSCFDNAVTESFFASLECELIDRQTFRTCADAERAIFSYIEGFYNPRRRHRAKGQRSPADYEHHYALTTTGRVPRGFRRIRRTAGIPARAPKAT
jgi:putative transposase